jgi:hypothetical protein
MIFALPCYFVTQSKSRFNPAAVVDGSTLDPRGPAGRRLICEVASPALADEIARGLNDEHAKQRRRARRRIFKITRGERNDQPCA